MWKCTCPQCKFVMYFPIKPRSSPTCPACNHLIFTSKQVRMLEESFVTRLYRRLRNKLREWHILYIKN